MVTYKTAGSDPAHSSKVSEWETADPKTVKKIKHIDGTSHSNAVEVEVSSFTNYGAVDNIGRNSY